jgi:hypothetical protein
MMGPKSRHPTARSSVIHAIPNAGPIENVIGRLPCARLALGAIWGRYTTQTRQLLISGRENGDLGNDSNGIVTFSSLILT